MKLTKDQRIEREKAEQFTYLRDRYCKLWGPAGDIAEASVLAAEHSGIEVIQPRIRRQYIA